MNFQQIRWKCLCGLLFLAIYISGCSWNKQAPVSTLPVTRSAPHRMSASWSKLLAATVQLQTLAPAGGQACSGLLACTRFLGPLAEPDRVWVVTPARCLVDRYVVGIQFSEQSSAAGECYARKVIVHNKFAMAAVARKGAPPLALMDNDLGLVQVSCQHRLPDPQSCVSLLPGMPRQSFDRYLLTGAHLEEWPKNPAEKKVLRPRILALQAVPDREIPRQARDAALLWLGPIDSGFCLDRIGAPVFVRVREEYYGAGFVSHIHCSLSSERKGMIQVTSIPEHFAWMSRTLVRVAAPPPNQPAPSVRSSSSSAAPQSLEP